MQAVGIRELKEQASELVRRVREERETIEVTYRGRAVARLVPIEQPQPPSRPDTAAAWASIDQLAAKIGARSPAGVSAADIVSAGRRDWSAEAER